LYFNNFFLIFELREKISYSNQLVVVYQLVELPTSSFIIDSWPYCNTVTLIIDRPPQIMSVYRLATTIYRPSIIIN